LFVVDCFQGKWPSCHLIPIWDKRRRCCSTELWSAVSGDCYYCPRWSCLFFHIILIHGVSSGQLVWPGCSGQLAAK